MPPAVALLALLAIAMIGLFVRARRDVRIRRRVVSGRHRRSGLPGRSAASSSATGRAAIRSTQLARDAAAVAERSQSSDKLKCDFAKRRGARHRVRRFADNGEADRDGLDARDCRQKPRSPRSMRRHLIETPLRPADLLFVFGTREDVARARR